MSLVYVEDTFDKIESMPDNVRPHGQGADGYGMKIAMPYKIRLNGTGPWRRVYCTCFSNVGSIWVEVNKVKYYFRDDERVRTVGEWKDFKRPVS